MDGSPCSWAPGPGRCQGAKGGQGPDGQREPGGEGGGGLGTVGGAQEVGEMHAESGVAGGEVKSAPSQRGLLPGSSL